jgi:hypothetical protein
LQNFMFLTAINLLQGNIATFTETGQQKSRRRQCLAKKLRK